MFGGARPRQDVGRGRPRFHGRRRLHHGARSGAARLRHGPSHESDLRRGRRAASAGSAGRALRPRGDPRRLRGHPGRQADRLATTSCSAATTIAAGPASSSATTSRSSGENGRGHHDDLPIWAREFGIDDIILGDGLIGLTHDLGAFVPLIEELLALAPELEELIELFLPGIDIDEVLEFLAADEPLTRVQRCRAAKTTSKATRAATCWPVTSSPG